MQEYRIRSTGEVVTEPVLRSMHECVFPATLDAAALEAAGADPVATVAPPVPGPLERVLRAGVLEASPGVWVQGWTIAPLSPSDLQARQAVVASEMAAYLTEVRETRERVLNRLAGIGATALILQDTGITDAYVLARQQLLDLTKLPAVLAAQTVPELSAACKAGYAQIVALCPPVLRTAILTVDA